MGNAHTPCNPQSENIAVIVAVLVRELAARARIQEALRGHAAVRTCDEQDELLALVTEGLVGVAVVDLRDRTGAPTLGMVRTIREGFPSVPVVAYCALTPDSSREILALARAGVNDLILRGVDDVGVALRSVITTAQEHCGAKHVLEAIAPLVPPSVVPFLRYSLEHARQAVTVADAAAALGVHRKTLVDRLATAGLPTPSAMIAWCRLTLAAQMLEDPARSVEQIALLLDFSSAASLRNMLKRYTGLSPREVRENGGLRCVLHAFRQMLVPPAQSAAAS
jgi:AraC-like DNA-binding protein